MEGVCELVAFSWIRRMMEVSHFYPLQKQIFRGKISGRMRVRVLNTILNDHADGPTIILSSSVVLSILD